MKTNLTFRDLYRFPGFRARATLKPHPEDPKGYIITLERRQKKTVCSGCGTTAFGYRDRRTHRVRDLHAGASRIYLAFEYRRVACPRCNAVKRETLSMLARSARFTQRVEFDLPEDLPESDPDIANVRTWYTWHLLVTVKE